MVYYTVHVGLDLLISWFVNYGNLPRIRVARDICWTIRPYACGTPSFWRSLAIRQEKLVEAVENMDADEVMSPEFFTAWAPATTAKRTNILDQMLLDSSWFNEPQVERILESGLSEIINQSINEHLGQSQSFWFDFASYESDLAMDESIRRGQTILDKFAIEHAAMLKEAACQPCCQCTHRFSPCRSYCRFHLKARLANFVMFFLGGYRQRIGQQTHRTPHRWQLHTVPYIPRHLPLLVLRL